MADSDVISLSSDDTSGPSSITRREILEPAVRHVVDALGGYENSRYRLGDSVPGCLRDLKTLWRKDDTDDERTVARLFFETRVLPNDLVPILLETAGKGMVEDKRAIAVVDLLCAMTWPIDLAEELKELDEELDRGSDYTQLLQSHLVYKSALLKQGVMQALFGIVLPPLSKSIKERTQRDGQIIFIVLHLFRNLAFIKDLPSNMHLSNDQAEFSTLQSKFIRYLSDTHVLELLLMIASNVDGDPLFNSWNTLLLEIFYLLFRGVKPTVLCVDLAKKPSKTLSTLLAAESQLKRSLRPVSSRHSRFGTTISVTLNPTKPRPSEDTVEAPTAQSQSQSLVLHRQQALMSESSVILDINKKSKAKRIGTDEIRREDNLSFEAKVILRGLAREFLGNCFNPFLRDLLKDIKSERPKITEKDNLRLLFLTKWFLEFFLGIREQEGLGKSVGDINGAEGEWSFGWVAEVTERGWIIWVLKRMREAVEEKPKLWTELQAGIECLTQLLLLLQSMSSSPSSSSTTEGLLADAAETLQHQLIYNGEVLDIAFESLRNYKEGTQSLGYLEKCVSLGYALFGMLEKWGKTRGSGDEVYVRRKKVGRKRKAKGKEGEEILDAEEEDQVEDEVVHETMFTFEAFQMKFAHSEITRSLLTYLARYRDFSSPECMKCVVSLLHRQAVQAKAEGLFFNVSTLNLFKTILDDQKSLPKDKPYQDLIRLINFILRKFFKALEEDSFLAVEAFFPKNRSQWKQFSSWVPEEKVKRARDDSDSRIPQDVQVKRGYSETDQLGIVIAALAEQGNLELVEWIKDILKEVIRKRQILIDETDGAGLDDDDGDHSIAKVPRNTSNEAVRKFEDYEIPYISEDQVNAVTKNPQLKLMLRLIKFKIVDEDADEPQWFVPKTIVPSQLRTTLSIISQFLYNPFDLNGKKASEFISRKSRRRRRRSSLSEDSDEEGEEDEQKKTKKEKRKKEKEQYKSNATIEDSDEECGDLEAFLEKEKALRERTARAAEGGRLGTMKATGTKKRQRKGADKAGGKKKRKGEAAAEVVETKVYEISLSDESDDNFGPSKKSSPTTEPPKQKHRPKPKPRFKSMSSRRSSISVGSTSPSPKDVVEINDNSDTQEILPLVNGVSQPQVRRRKGRLVISDEED